MCAKIRNNFIMYVICRENINKLLDLLQFQNDVNNNLAFFGGEFGEVDAAVTSAKVKISESKQRVKVGFFLLYLSPSKGSRLFFLIIFESKQRVKVGFFFIIFESKQRVKVGFFSYLIFPSPSKGLRLVFFLIFVIVDLQYKHIYAQLMIIILSINEA